jgi:hypothetical protein
MTLLLRQPFVKRQRPSRLGLDGLMLVHGQLGQPQSAEFFDLPARPTVGRHVEPRVAGRRSRTSVSHTLH